MTVTGATVGTPSLVQGSGNKQWKVDFTYKGAQARGGSLTSFDAFSKLVGQHNAKVGAGFLKQYKIGNELFKAQNKIHEKTKTEFRNKYGKEAYDKAEYIAKGVAKEEKMIGREYSTYM